MEPNEQKPLRTIEYSLLGSTPYYSPRLDLKLIKRTLNDPLRTPKIGFPVRQRQSLEPLRFRVYLGPGFRSSPTGLHGKRVEPPIALPASFLALLLSLRISGMRDSRLYSLHSLQSSGDGGNLVVLMVFGGLAHCLICSSVRSPR